MKLTKKTKDGFFTLAIESKKWDTAKKIPIKSIQLLIEELEELRSQLLGFVVESGKDQLLRN